MGVCCATASKDSYARKQVTGASDCSLVPPLRVLCRSLRKVSQDRLSLSTVSAVQGEHSELKQLQCLYQVQTQRLMHPSFRRTDSIRSWEPKGSPLTLQYSPSDLAHSGLSATSFDLVSPLRSCCSLGKQLSLPEDVVSNVERQDEERITRTLRKTYTEDGRVQINQYTLGDLLARSPTCMRYSATIDTDSFLLTIIKTEADVLSQAAELWKVRHSNALVELIVPHCQTQLIIVQRWSAFPGSLLSIPAEQFN